MTTTFQEYLSREREQSIKIFKSYWRDWRKQHENIDPTNTKMFDYLETYLLRGGKWHRPVLFRLAYALTDNTPLTKAVQRASLTTEILHRFILVHDDLIDQDQERHGGPTLERVFVDELTKLHPVHATETYASGMAMIAGDLLHVLAQDLALETGVSKEIGVRLIQALNDCFVTTAAGWRLETVLKQKSIEQTNEVEVYRAMLLVSAHYSVLWPLRLGQVAAGVDRGAWSPALETYGEKVGLAFQIQDDILGILGESEKTGKPVGNDLREGKKTILLLHAYAGLPKFKQHFLEQMIGKQITPEQLAKVHELLKKTGALEEAQVQARSLVTEAHQALQQLHKRQKQTEAYERLWQLGDYLANRDV